MNPIEIVKGDTVTKRYQLQKDGVAQPITGMTFKFAVKAKYTDTTYLINPITATIDDAANGKFSFVIGPPDTDTVMTGVFEITMTDGAGKRTTLTPKGGFPFEISENLID